VLARPIVQMLFEHGHFNAESTRRTSAVLVCYTVGLFAYSGQKILNNGFYGAQNTRIPMTVGGVALIVNVAVSLSLMHFLKEAGLALATSISGIFQFIALAVLYYRRVAAFDIKGTLVAFLRILAASTAMGVVCIWLFSMLETRLPGSGNWFHMIRVLTTMFLSVLSYPLFCLLFGVKEMKGLLEKITPRFFRKRPAQP